MAWSVSAELIVMVVLGHLLCQYFWRDNLTALVVSPIAGTLTFLIVEETLKAYTEHWPLILGILIVLGVLFSGVKPHKGAA
jgi:branched-chain amino acid transport system permease protein